MIIIFPLAVLIAVSLLYRSDLGVRTLSVYWSLWAAGLLIVLGFSLSPGIFLSMKCALAIAMLIQVRANPQL